MAEWSKDHVAAIGYLNLTLVSWIIVKLETGRGPYVESADRRMEWSGSGLWKAGTFKALAPTCVD
jgi:hypothetical protein